MGSHLCRSERLRPTCDPEILLQSDIGAIIRPPGSVIGGGTYEFNPKYDKPPEVDNSNDTNASSPAAPTMIAKRGPQNKLMKDKFVYVKKAPMARA